MYRTRNNYLPVRTINLRNIVYVHDFKDTLTNKTPASEMSLILILMGYDKTKRSINHTLSL